MNTPQKSYFLSRTSARLAGFVAVAVLAGALASSPTPGLARNVAKKQRKPEALILGDSVMSILGVGDEALAALNKKHPVIFGARPCQLLLKPGCIPGTKESALEVFRKSKGKFSDVVIVSTGYNEYSDEFLTQALTEFKKEAKRQKVSLVWLTYRENGNVKAKSKRFNSILRKAAKKDSSLFLYDWNEHSLGKNGWYSGDKIHMSRRGGMYMALYLSRTIREVIAVRDAPKVSLTTTATTAVTETSVVPETTVVASVPATTETTPL